jgi:hypothetical protein
MPEPISTGAMLALGLGGQALSNAFGAYGQERANQQNMDLAAAQQGWNRQNWMMEKNWQKKAWEKQNEYNLQLWNMQNEYNSPAAQMQRFKEAGLNPHLIYGRGSSGLAGAPAQASTNLGSGPQPAKRAEAQNVFRGMDAFSNAAPYANLAAQTSNIRAQEALTMQERQNKALLAAGIAVDNKQKEVNLGVSSRIADYNVQAAQWNAQKATEEAIQSAWKTKLTRQTYDSTVKQIEADVAKTIQDTNESLAREKNYTVQNQVLDIQRQLNKETLKLNLRGLTWSDPYGIRILHQITSKTPLQVDPPSTPGAPPKVRQKRSKELNIEDYKSDPFMKYQRD